MSPSSRSLARRRILALLAAAMAAPLPLVAAANDGATGAALPAPLAYPAARRDALVEEHFGTKVPAPYRWMEELDAPEVTQWVEAENRLTFGFLDGIPQRPWIRDRLTKLWNYERVGVPERNAAGELFFSRNSGLQNQSPVYEQASLDAQPKQILDPNALSPDGSVALLGDAPSPDGRYLAYALSEGGSDWRTIHVLDLRSGKETGDRVQWAKFSGISWTRDDGGFYYSRFPEPPAGKAISEQVTHQKLYYHRLGAPQSEDRLVFERNDLPDWYVGGHVSEDGRYLFVTLNHGTDTSNQLFVAELADAKHPKIDAPLRALYTKNDAEYYPLGVVDGTLYLQTNLDAPKRRIVGTPLAGPEPEKWRVVVPESANVIEDSTIAGGEVVVAYLVDVKSEVDLFGRDGKPAGKLDLPGIGSVAGLSARDDRPEIFYAFTSFTTPTTIFRYDMKAGRSEVFHRPTLDFDGSRYETRQIFTTSKDGTRIPIFVTAEKGLKLDGSHPTLLYAYGGFDVSETPYFSSTVAVWLEMGGVYAVATLRGGGEYGEAWHQAGMLGKKQNVFDDFAAAAKALVDEKITSRDHLGIEGYSNGGLLVGASITEHPELFGAAYAGAGVMDMLRYQKFSAGIGWVPEYGSADDEQAFHWLDAYSPLHNLMPGSCYPPTIVTTADHDDRVVPSHSFKFTAALQKAQGCANPVLIRVETGGSHGYRPTDKRIAELADEWAFAAEQMGRRKDLRP
jgi:prolyl oligopeptidase